MAFDGIVINKIVCELQNIIDYKIDKILQPDKNTIILGLYGKNTNLALLCSISSNNYRLYLTTHNFKNPSSAPNFCMLLRKHILGYKIKNIYTQNSERIIFIDLENYENPDKPIVKTLIIELMGKHSNIILTYENEIIIDSLRHTSSEENALRDIYPTSRYIFPDSKKYDLFKIQNFDVFKQKVGKLEDNFVTQIINTFNGLSPAFVNSIYIKGKSLEVFYNKLSKFLTSSNFDIQMILNKNNLPKDYNLVLSSSNPATFKLNFILDDFYYSKETNELFTNYRNSILSLILNTLKKYEKRLSNIDDKLTECKHKDKFKLYGELITANLYKLPNYNIDSIDLENYYDNNNMIKIPLDKRYSPSHNAKIFFKKYSKLKNALEIVGNQKQETINDINYIESIVYELENCHTLEDVQEIYNEISENDIFKINIAKKSPKKVSKNPKKQMTSNKFAKFNPLKFNVDDYIIYVGRNNKENDYLTNKFANKNDIWFHTKDIHGSHVILKTHPHEVVPENIIYEAAKLSALHSKAKGSSNIPVDYCLVKYVKKLPGNKPGLVIYTNNKTIYI